MKLNKDAKTLAAIGDLVEYAFLKNYDVTKDHNFLERYHHSDGYGEFHDGKLMSYVMANNFSSQIFKQKVKMAGVGYVASFPENRGHGDISRIMEEILQDCHRHNVALSNLAPWSETFYRQYSYENAIYQKTLEISPAMFKFFKLIKDCKIIRGKWDDSEVQKLVLKLYQKQLSSGNERNTVSRAKWWWDRFTTYYPGRFAAVALNEKREPEAYLFYRIIDDTFYAEELYFNNVSGAKNLLAFIGSHLSSCNSFRITMPVESHLEDLFPDQAGIKVMIKPYMMSRIIDFQKIAACIPIEKATSVKVEVTNDKQCPWNNGVWQISAGTVKKTSEKPDYRGPITAWTKVLLGNLSVEQAVELGLLERINNKDFVIKKGTVSFYDYF